MAITQYYYSPSTKGIYSAEVHGTGIPTDRVAITLAQYAQVAAGTHSVTVSGTTATTVQITPQAAGTLNTGIGLATPTSKLHLFVDGNVGASNPAISPLSISTGTVNAEKILIRNDVITSGSNNWYRLSLPQSYAATDPQTNGGTVTVSVTWHPLHASNSFCQEYKLTYGTQYTLGPGFLSITSVQPVYFGKAKQTYSGYSTSPNVDFEYDATGGYLYFNISGASASYNKEKSIKVVVNGKTVSEPQLIQTTAPTGTNKLSKISEIPGGKYSTSIFKEIPVSSPSYLYQYLKLFRHNTGINGADTGGYTTHFAGTISAIRINDLGVTTSSYISVSRTYQGYFFFSQTCNHGRPYELRNIEDETGQTWLCLRCPQSNPGVHLFTVNGSFTDVAKEDHTQYNQLPFEAMIGGAGTATTFGADISTPITEGTALNNVLYSSVQTDAPAIFKRTVAVVGDLTLDGNIRFNKNSADPAPCKLGLVGVYDPEKTQAIWAMGAAYTLGTDPGSTAYANHYGLAWSYNPDYNNVTGNNPQSKAGLSHQLLIQHAGQTKTAIGIGIWTSGTVTAPTANITTANVNTLNINATGTGIVLPASGNAQQICFGDQGAPTLPNSLQSPTVAALPYSIYREGGGWDFPYPDLVISYHTGIKLIAEKSYGGTRFYSHFGASLQTDAHILLSVGNGDDHVRVGSPTNTTSDLIAYGKVTATSFVGNGITPIGGIIMWSGTIANIPSGWAFCNGSNGTPDLRDRFIISANSDSTGAKTNVTGALTQSGGSKDAVVVSHTHAITDPGHSHTYNYRVQLANQSGSSTPCWARDTTATTTSNTTGISINSNGVDGTNKNLPPYYALAYIMRTA